MSTVAPNPSPRSRSPWLWVILGGACLLVTLLVVLTGVVGIVIYRTVTQTAQGADGGPAAARSGPAVPGGQEPGVPYLQFGDETSDTTLDVYVDFLCPYCKQFEEINGADVKALADSGVSVRIHPRPMLDSMTTPAGYSGRAANAAACVYDEDPQAFWAMSRKLYELQPAEGSAGLDDATLTEAASGVVPSDAVTTCIADGTYIPWLEDVVEPEARSKTQGTPTVLINGAAFTGDMLQPGALKAAVEAA